MTRLRRLLPAILALALLPSCSEAPPPVLEEQKREPWEQAEIFLSYATAATAQNSIGSSALNTALLEASGGRIYCNVYTDGQMGGDAELLHAVREGSISVIQSAASVQTELIPELALLDIPYLFPDIKSCSEQLDGALMDFFQPYYNQKGLQLLSWSCMGFRQLSSSIPVEKPEDVEELVIRTVDNKYHQVYWEAVGAETCSVPFGKLFYAAQQGMINAEENAVGAMISIGLQKVQPYLVYTNHIPFINTIVMNKEVFDNLSQQDREIVVQVFREQSSSGTARLTEQDVEAAFPYRSFPSAALQEKLRSGVPVMRQALEQDLGVEAIQQFYEIVNQKDQDD